MFLSLTNALWFAETRLGSNGANRLAMILVTNFAKLWIKLIGQKSFTSTASVFLGSKVIKVVLRCPKLKTWPLKMASRAMSKSPLMMFQQVL
jgi:hypothetical protein